VISRLRFVVEGGSQLSEAAVQSDNPIAVVEYYRKHIEPDPTHERNKEQVVVLLLNVRMGITAHTVISVGTVDSCIVEPRDILRPVILGGGKTFIMLHNHPSGHLDPSQCDRNATRKVRESAELMNLKLVDHIIVSSGPGYYSFAESGSL